MKENQTLRNINRIITMKKYNKIKKILFTAICGGLFIACQQPHNVNDPLQVLCLGNSITKHPIKEDIEWFSDWGMAASNIEYDYCHQLEKMLCKYHPNSTVTPLNIASWERNLSCDIDSLIGSYCKNKDIIIIRLGENVQDVTTFPDAISRLVKYCQSKAKRVIITGCFWKNDSKERSIIHAARTNDLTYVPLYWIDNLYNVRPQIGDTLYDINKKPYVITQDFIITHPNDEGMQMIAETIWGVIR